MLPPNPLLNVQLLKSQARVRQEARHPKGVSHVEPQSAWTCSDKTHKERQQHTR